MKISIFHANAGHGHRKIAEVIAKAFLKRGLSESEVSVHDALDFTPAWFRAFYPWSYFQSVKNTPKLWGWFYDLLDKSNIYKWIFPLRATFNKIIASRLLKNVLLENPDVIITTHFLSAQLFADAKKHADLKSKLITVITDFFPHSFWLNEGTDSYWVMADESRDALRKRGIKEELIKPLGIPVEDSFKPTGRKNDYRAKFKLEQNRFTILLTSGSFGLGPQSAILDQLSVFSDKVQCIVVCGTNRSLEQELRAKAYSFPCLIFGFVDFMPELMEASDLIIAKSGGSTTTESLAKGIPMVVLEPIPGQETRNAELLKKRNTSFFLKQPDQIKIILDAIFKDPQLLSLKLNEINRLAKPHAADDLVTYALSQII